MNPKTAPDKSPDANQTDSTIADTEGALNHQGDSAHMGAEESQVVPTTPPTEALDKLLRESPPQEKDSDSEAVSETVDDQFTPG